MTVLATFARVYVTDIDAAIEALRACGIADVRLRFGHAAGLQLALVGDVLVLAASEEMLEPFRTTDLTVIVTDLDQAIRDAQTAGAVITRAPAEQVVGRNVTLRFPAGPIIEFVEWDQQTRTAAGV